jgi:hypothetical protein
LEKTHGAQFDIYWHGQPGQPGIPRMPGLFKHINDLDTERHYIVHWHLVREINNGESQEVLRRPAFFWLEPGSTEKITSETLISFIAKANFIIRSINMFHITIDLVPRHPAIPEAERPPWLRIFQQPVPYPPSDTHPLSPNYKAPENSPQPSGV